MITQIFNDEKGLPKPKKYEWIVYSAVPVGAVGVELVDSYIGSGYFICMKDPTGVLLPDEILIGKREVV